MIYAIIFTLVSISVWIWIDVALKVGREIHEASMKKKAIRALAQDNPSITMEDIKLHNANASGYDQGFSDAIDRIKDWKESMLKKGISIFD